MFDCYRKYLLVRCASDCGIDDGADFNLKRKALQCAREYLRDGWETVACINTQQLRIEFIVGESRDVYGWFNPRCAAVLEANTIRHSA